MSDYKAVTEAMRVGYQQTATLRGVMASRARPRCDCGGIVWVSTCICGSCGAIYIEAHRSAV